MPTLGFIGLGAMGSAMARRLVDAGHDIVVWNRSPAAMESLVAAGARPANEAGDALAVDVSFSMVANDAAMAAVFTDDVVTAATGSTHVAMASISPDMARLSSERLRAAGAAYVAAPVLGRPPVAVAGQLNILAAGSGEAIDAVQPYLEVLGRRVWRLGEEPHVANAVKAAVNYNIIHAMQAIGESVAMTERLGVDARLFTELLGETLFGGVVYTGYGDIIARRAYTPAGFTAALGRKDLGLAEELAVATGVTPATLQALKEVFEIVLADPGLGPEADWSAIAEVSRRDLR